MTLDPHLPGDADDLVARAADALRAHADERWVEISDRVLGRALNVTRRSMPVRAASSGGPVNVSEQVLVAGIRSALDGLSGAAPVDIRISTDEQHRYTGVFIALAVDYKSAILPVADHARHCVRDVLLTLLGPVSPPVTVTTMQVHVDDVREPQDTEPSPGRPTSPG
ncbi:MAG: hypothetical protein ABJA33_05015 [Pedococcus sp.]